MKLGVNEIEEGELPMKFKVGDKIRIVSSKENYFNTNEDMLRLEGSGTIGVILQATTMEENTRSRKFGVGEFVGYECKFSKDNWSEWWYSENCLELYTG